MRSVYAASMWRAAILLLGMVGCSSTPAEPLFHDDKYLRFGVDPNAEANAVIESQKERSYRLSQRLVGQHFTALGFRDKGGRSSAVRILTVRGIGVALDRQPQSPVQPAKSYALVAPPIQGTHDADHDGFEEVFVEEQTQGDVCLRVYRVRDVGFIDPVVVDSQVLGQEICPNAAIDLDRDGVIELSTELELGGFPSAGGAVPHVRVPLWADQHRFVARPGSGPQQAWLARERASRELELERARARRDIASCYVFGVELAALAYLERSDPAAQLAAFDRALRGLVLTQPQAAANLNARARIYTDWNDPGHIAAPRAIARLPAKALDEPVARASNASKTNSANDSRSAQRAGMRLAPAPRPQQTVASATPASREEPVLAEGEFVITPQSAAAEEAERRAAKARIAAGANARTNEAVPARTDPAANARTGAAVPARTDPSSHATTGPAANAPNNAGVPARTVPGVNTPADTSAPAPRVQLQPLAADEWNAYRAVARELGNAAVAERKWAATARQAAVAERREAQAARLRVLHAGDPAIASEHRATVAEHVAAAERYAAEAAEHAAEAARQRAALAEHKARLTGVDPSTLTP